MERERGPKRRNVDMLSKSETDGVKLTSTDIHIQ